MPSGTSLVSTGDDTLRQHWASLQSGIIEEHFFSDSSSSAGIHKLGSARIQVGLTSLVSTSDADDEGRLIYGTDKKGLHLLGDSATTRIASDSNIVSHSSVPSGGVTNTPFMQSLVATYIQNKFFEWPHLFASGTTPAAIISAFTTNDTNALNTQLDFVDRSGCSVSLRENLTPGAGGNWDTTTGSGITLHIIAFGEVAESALS